METEREEKKQCRVEISVLREREKEGMMIKTCEREREGGNLEGCCVFQVLHITLQTT